MKEPKQTNTKDISGRLIKVGDIVGYDFDDESSLFEVVFEGGEFRKKYEGWDNTLPKPLLEQGGDAICMRLNVVQKNNNSKR